MDDRWKGVTLQYAQHCDCPTITWVINPQAMFEQLWVTRRWRASSGGRDVTIVLQYSSPDYVGGGRHGFEFGPGICKVRLLVSFVLGDVFRHFNVQCKPFRLSRLCCDLARMSLLSALL